ncbi:hypothetical protein MMC27_005567 [Xylographa pallens]|nr:hypothetical protein [Xylographa pallens]
MASSSIVRRALLYVPGSSQKMLEKSRGLAVDCVAYDLEDSVTPSKKSEARSNIRRLLDQPRATGIKEQSVRINAVESGLALDDLAEVLKAQHLDTIVVPKVNSASDLYFVADVIRHSQKSSSAPIQILALIESAKALSSLSSICTATPLLSGLIFAAEDFALDLSLTRTPSLTEFLYARSAIVTACRAHDLPSAIDLVCTAYKGEEGQRVLEEECLGGKGLGFNGKQCIHPSQVDITQSAFAPGQSEVEWAVRVTIADEKAANLGRGAWTLEGKMIDAPVAGKAKATVSRAAACGFDIEAVKKKWSGQEPE